MRSGLLAACAAMALGATWLMGCAPLPAEVQLTEGFAAPDNPYGRALRQHTRAVELYEGFDTIAKVWATWRTPDLREALVKASARAYRMAKEGEEALRKDEEEAARRGREFHLAVYTPKKQWNDLESPGTLWRLVLELPDGSRSEPLKVRYLVKTDKSAVEYPYVTLWTREYSVLFPLLDEEAVPRGKGTLVMTGPLGTARLEF
jgi:hypothetical protein